MCKEDCGQVESDKAIEYQQLVEKYKRLLKSLGEQKHDFDDFIDHENEG